MYVTKVIKNIFLPSNTSDMVMWNNHNLQNNGSFFPPWIKSLLLFGSFASILFGVQLWLISTNGNATPFWDQWDAEANGLYRPYLNHTLTFRQLLQPHNEHRIFTTRLLALVLLKVNHSWNPMLQMIVNAGLHVLAILAAIYFIIRVIGQNSLVPMLAFSLVLFGLPYGWENTLAGFQSQFYFVLLFSFTGLWLLLCHEPISVGWWFGIVLAVLAFFSLASGVFVPASAALVSIIVFFTNLRRTPRQLLAIVILVSLFIAGVKLTPTLAHHANLKASSFHQFYEAFVLACGWPVSNNFIGALICNLPILIFILVVFKKRLAVRDNKWFFLAFIIWLFMQVVGIAQGRAVQALSSRYRDLYSALILANFASLLYLLYNHSATWKKGMIIGAGLWITILLVSFTRYSLSYLPFEISTRHKLTKIEEENTRNYLVSRDINSLKNKPPFYIPYPSAEGLAAILEQPGIRDILPADINAPLKSSSVEIKPVGAFVGNGYDSTMRKRVDTTWGSCIPGAGSDGKGEMILHFKNDSRATRIAIPVAGYPLYDSMSIEIKQNGISRRVSVFDNPRESWRMGYAKIDKGDFSIVLKDSTRWWIAVAGPVFAGNLDPITDRILSKFTFFILLGILGILFLTIENGIRRKTAMSNTT